MTDSYSSAIPGTAEYGPVTRANLSEAYEYIATAKTRSTDNRLAFLQRMRPYAEQYGLIEQAEKAYRAVVHHEMFRLESMQVQITRSEAFDQ